VNWNTGNLLEECLYSISRFNNSLVKKIVVVDNNSDDQSFNCVKSYKNVELIHLEKNYGFAKACNIGAKNCNSDYFLFLNPDARLTKLTLPGLVQYMDSPESKNVGISGVQLLDNNSQVTYSCSRFPTLFRYFCYSIGLLKIFPAFGSPMRDWPHTSNGEVDQIMGALFFVRSSLFISLKGFDERFFVYMEEVDFSFRAKLQGNNSFFLASVSAYHVGGGSSEKVKAKRIFYSTRSRILYMAKHYSVLKTIATIFISISIEPLCRIIFGIIKLSTYSIIEAIHSYLMLIRWLPNMLFRKNWQP
tara:strand:- start:759 stop:1667 length:909 start_codon:yes stop_codon:yes gene_type:complete